MGLDLLRIALAKSDQLVAAVQPAGNDEMDRLEAYSDAYDMLAQAVRDALSLDLQRVERHPDDGPPPEQVRRLGSYSSLCGTWWDTNCTHSPSTPAALPWRACGAVEGRAVDVDAGEAPTCGGCRQLLRMRHEREVMRERSRK